MQKHYGDVALTLQGHVALVEIQRPPYNYFDVELIADLARAYADMDANAECRALVLAAQGKVFCAGAQFNPDDSNAADNTVTERLYQEGVQMLRVSKPVVGAIHGAAVGGGLGVALTCDFRICCAESRFAANFVKLGIHPGFGISLTLPRLIGQQRAALMLLTGRRIGGDQALEWGLADVLVEREQVRDEALKLAGEIAANAPLAVISTRTTLRQAFADAVEEQTKHELSEQIWQRKTEDHIEGVRAVAERRDGEFTGR